ncbi:MAG: ABC transporter permease, partial [Lachnospiraceae bacterium]|nr:ABC transporter permease [Lachnospiraceae bacterium]
MIKTTLREIKGSLGRYLAIFAIVMLGIGFFAGLKMAKPAMVDTEDEYLRNLNFFDYRLLSTVGFTEDDVEALKDWPQAADVEGTLSVDALISVEEGNEEVYKFHALPSNINMISLTSGRMPQAANECILDAAQAGEDAIGSEIRITDDNTEDTLEMFGERTYTIVGLANSPLYLNFERGTSSIGDGRIKGFIYVPAEAFDCDYLTEIYLTLVEKHTVYSDAYEDYIDATQDELENMTEQLVQDRYDGL